MKYFFLLLIPASLLFACNANDTKSTPTETAALKNAVSDSANYTTVQWLDSTHRTMGTVQQGQVVEVSWRFKNTGNKPLVIASASASCGCTVADKPEQPVSPGETGTIKARFDSKGREGTERKQVFVTANTQTPNHELSFEVEVKK